MKTRRYKTWEELYNKHGYESSKKLGSWWYLISDLEPIQEPPITREDRAKVTMGDLVGNYSMAISKRGSQERLVLTRLAWR